MKICPTENLATKKNRENAKSLKKLREIDYFVQVHRIAFILI